MNTAKKETRSYPLGSLTMTVRAKPKASSEPLDNDLDDDGDDDDSDDEEASLQGRAIVYNSPSEDLGGFREIIAPGALTRSLSAVAAGDANVFALWSHDWSQPLGSTRGGKLAISEDDQGLAFRLDPSRLTPAQRSAAEDGELRMSFGFVVVRQSWAEDDSGVIRTVHDLDLHEISPVVLPAYPTTDAALRSLEEWRKSVQSNDEAKYLQKSTRMSLLKKWADRRSR